MCAQHTWHSLGGDYGNPPAWGAGTANEAITKVKNSGRYWTPSSWDGHPPRGAWVGWTYGKSGHAALSLGDGRIATTDPTGDSGGSGIEPIHYPEKWGAGNWTVWTDEYNGVRFPVAYGVTPGEVYLSKLVYGQKDSDSVSRLQDVLNGHPLSEGSVLPLTGNYLDSTDHEVRLCQQQHGFGNDPVGASSVGPSQADHLFAGSGHTVHNDLDNGTDGGSPPTGGTDPAETKTFPLGIEYHYSGKPAGELTFSGSYKKLDVAAWAPKKKGLTFGMLYANVDGEGEFRTRLIRDPDDATAYQTHYAKSGDNYLLTHLWFESGEAGRKLWYEFCSMDGTSHTVTTRYAKFFTIPWDVVVVVEQIGAAVTAVSRPVGRFVNWVRG